MNFKKLLLLHKSGVLFSGITMVLINVVVLRWARLVLGWVTVCNPENYLHTKVWFIYNQLSNCKQL